MNKFEKIKTIADKRIAATKRGKLVANDFQAGDSLFITEKVDGHNASFSSEGDAFSREQLIDPKTNAPLVPFSEFVSQLSPTLKTLIASELDATHDYQFYGEFMVKNRVVKYNDDIYNKWVFFDILDTTTQTYLGTQKAIELSDALRNSVSSTVGDLILTPKVLNDNHEFVDYASLEKYVHDHASKSLIGVDGVMEGAVISNLSRRFQNKPLRAKVVNAAFKETQRQVTNHKNHSLEMRNLLQYLTQTRVSKIIMNMQDTGLLNPLSNGYYTTQLELVVRQIAKDIHDETDLKLPYQTMVAGEDIYNKIEGMSRLTMIDLRNRV